MNTAAKIHCVNPDFGNFTWVLDFNGLTQIRLEISTAACMGEPLVEHMKACGFYTPELKSPRTVRLTGADDIRAAMFFLLGEEHELYRLIDKWADLYGAFHWTQRPTRVKVELARVAAKVKEVYLDGEG